MGTWENLSTEEYFSDFIDNKGVFNNNIKESIIKALQQASERIKANSGKGYLPYPIIIGEIHKKQLENWYGKEKIEELTKKGEIKWI